MAGKKYFLEVAAGPDKGRRFPLPEGETVLGRSSACGIALADPVLSRRHCAITLAGGSLEITDLDSANGTVVNDAEVKRARLSPGDLVKIGETALNVAEDAPASSAPVPAQAQEGKAAAEPAPAADAQSGPIVDLGFEGDSSAAAAPKKAHLRPLLWAVGAVAVLAAASSFILGEGDGDGDSAAAIAPPPQPSPLPLVIDYEKVEAGTANIFRYRMTLSPDGELAISIDDLAENRHVRKSAPTGEEVRARLARQLEGAGLFALKPMEPGVSPDGSLTRRAFTISSGKRLAGVVAENRAAPQAFDGICEMLETFGRNELGIWAIQYPAEKLVELARESLTHAQNLFEQRAIAHGNVFNSILAFREAAFYLETVEPKPAFFGEITAGLAEAETLLGQRYEEQRFKADRAINLKDWRTAAEELRVIREQIPDEADSRNADATRKLLDVENRIKKGMK